MKKEEKTFKLKIKKSIRPKNIKLTKDKSRPRKIKIDVLTGDKTM